MGVLIPPATAADVAAGSNAVKPVTPATAKSHLSACKAWVNFNGTGVVAIRSSFGVSSVTDNGVANFSVNFSAAMADANYVTQVSTNLAVSADRSYTATPEQTADFTRIYHYEQNVAVDPSIVNVAVWGNQ